MTSFWPLQLLILGDLGQNFFRWCVELMPGEVLKISKRYSQPNLSYWRKTNRGALWAPLIRSRVKRKKRKANIMWHFHMSWYWYLHWFERTYWFLLVKHYTTESMQDWICKQNVCILLDQKSTNLFPENVLQHLLNVFSSPCLQCSYWIIEHLFWH